MKRLVVLLSTLGLTASALTQAALAQEVTFSFDNEFTQTVKIEFYSLDRNHVWPGNDEIYVLGPSDGIGTYPLSCVPNELICFGAWTEGNRDSWGAGRDLEFECSDCCAVCDGRTIDTITLN